MTAGLQVGADIEKAKQHGQANRLKIPGTEEYFPVCSTDTNELDFLGTGYPIYFTFLKRLGVFLMMLSIPITCITYYQNSDIDAKLSEFNGHQV